MHTATLKDLTDNLLLGMWIGAGTVAIEWR
jgi:hypothetical protein